MVTGEAGGFVEIARLYLTREPDGNPENDELYVQQLVFWDLMAMIVQPGQGILELADLIAGDGVLGQLEAGQLEQTLAGTAEFMVWNS